MKLITALFASTLILTMGSYRQADVPPVTRDTLSPIGKHKIDSIIRDWIIIHDRNKSIWESITADTIKKVLVIGVRLVPEPSPIPDTTKPTYSYFYKFQGPVNRIDAAYDTIRRFVLPVIGNRMFKDESEYYQTLLMNQINSIIGRPVVDSVKVGGKP